MKEEEFLQYLKTAKQTINYYKTNNTSTSKLSEEDTKCKFINPLLNVLGYNEVSIKRETHEGNSRKRSDVIIDVTSDVFYLDREQIVVETKKLKQSLSKKITCEFIEKYMKDKKPSWGILTNGNTYKLFGQKLSKFNDELELYSAFLDIENINLEDGDKFSQLYEEIKILSKEYIMDSIYVKYLMALTDFLVYKRENYLLKHPNKNPTNTLRAYRNELDCFIHYMMVYHPHAQFNEINTYMIREFAEYRCNLKKRRGRIKSWSRLDTILNYVISFFSYCYNNKLSCFSNPDIKNIRIQQLSKEIYDKINGNTDKSSLQSPKSSPITRKDMIQILKTAKMRITENEDIGKENYYLSFRDFIIIILALTYGMKKEDIKNLNWSQINLKHGIIQLKQKKFHIPETIQNELIEYKKIYDEYYIVSNTDVKPKFLFLTSIKYHNTSGKRVKQMNDPDLQYCINSIITDSKINTQRYGNISFENLAITSIGTILEQIQDLTLITDIIDKKLTIRDLKNVYSKLGYNTQKIANQNIERHPVVDLIKEAMNES